MSADWWFESGICAHAPHPREPNAGLFKTMSERVFLVALFEFGS